MWAPSLPPVGERFKELQELLHRSRPHTIGDRLGAGGVLRQQVSASRAGVAAVLGFGSKVEEKLLSKAGKHVAGAAIPLEPWRPSLRSLVPCACPGSSCTRDGLVAALPLHRTAQVAVEAHVAGAHNPKGETVCRASASLQSNVTVGAPPQRVNSDVVPSIEPSSVVAGRKRVVAPSNGRRWISRHWGNKSRAEAFLVQEAEKVASACGKAGVRKLRNCARAILCPGAEHAHSSVNGVLVDKNVESPVDAPHKCAVACGGLDVEEGFSTASSQSSKTSSSPLFFDLAADDLEAEELEFFPDMSCVTPWKGWVQQFDIAGMENEVQQFDIASTEDEMLEEDQYSNLEFYL